MNLTVHTITTEVALYYHVDIAQVFLIYRGKENIKYKHISIYFIDYFLKMTREAIGQEFPGRNGYLDHATITSALRSVRDQYDTNKFYRQEVDEIRKRLEVYIEDVRKVDEEIFMENDYYTN